MKILYLCYVWPEPTSSAAGVRSREWIRWLSETGAQLIVASAASKSVRSFDIEQEFPGVQSKTIALNSAQFDSWLVQHSFDLVLYDRFVVEEQFGGRVARALPRAIQWMDTQDLHSLRIGREAELGLQDVQLAQEIRVRELAAIYRVDRTFVVSSAELTILSGLGFACDQVGYLPWPVQRECISAVPRNLNKAVWIGNCKHPPNKDGLKWFISEIWPALHSYHSSLSLDLWGPYAATEWTKALKHGRGQIRYRGPWDGSAQALLSQYGFSVAPLRYGAGLKGKVLESLAAGTPVIGTPIAWEGIRPVDSGEDSWVCESNESWIRRFREWSEPDQWTKIQAWGFNRIAQEFSREGLDPKFRAEFSARAKTNHLISSMLRYHTMRSTEYFSKWVELKRQLS